MYIDPYECAKDTHAIAILTEWDELLIMIIKLYIIK